jgi:hypothetical protein
MKFSGKSAERPMKSGRGGPDDGLTGCCKTGPLAGRSHPGPGWIAVDWLATADPAAVAGRLPVQATANRLRIRTKL